MESSMAVLDFPIAVVQENIKDKSQNMMRIGELQ